MSDLHEYYEAMKEIEEPKHIGLKCTTCGQLVDYAISHGGHFMCERCYREIVMGEL